MTEYIRDFGFEIQDQDCDFVMGICEKCGKHTPPNECELCLSDAYKKCSKIIEAYKNRRACEGYREDVS